MNEHLREAYIAGHKACGLKVGDRVRLTRVAQSQEQGWGKHWIEIMNDWVGEILIIDYDSGEDGFHVREGCYYPWFVLKKIGDAKPDLLEGLDFGCQTEYVRKLIERLDARYGYKEAPDAKR
jgi:hypothetical protein